MRKNVACGFTAPRSSAVGSQHCKRPQLPIREAQFWFPDADRQLLPNGRTRDLPVPRDKERMHMPGSVTTLVRVLALKCARPCCLPLIAQRRHPGFMLSRLNCWPMHSPTDASPAPSRAPVHGSGPMRFAIPSSQRTCHRLLLAGIPALTRFSFWHGTWCPAFFHSVCATEPCSLGGCEAISFLVFLARFLARVAAAISSMVLTTAGIGLPKRLT